MGGVFLRACVSCVLASLLACACARVCALSGQVGEVVFDGQLQHRLLERAGCDAALLNAFFARCRACCAGVAAARLESVDGELPVSEGDALGCVGIAAARPESVDVELAVSEGDARTHAKGGFHAAQALDAAGSGESVIATEVVASA